MKSLNDKSKVIQVQIQISKKDISCLQHAGQDGHEHIQAEGGKKSKAPEELFCSRWRRPLRRWRRTLRRWTSTSRYLLQSVVTADASWWPESLLCRPGSWHVLILVQDMYSHVTNDQELMPSCRWSSSASSSFCSARSPSKVWSRLPNQSSWESSWPGQFLHRPAPHRPLRHRHLLLPQQLPLRENQQNLVTLWHLWST